MATSKICSVEGCGKPHKAFGLCNMHRQRLTRRGTTDRDPTWVRGVNCERGRAMKQCPAAVSLWNHLNYVQNKEKYIARARGWDAANIERKRELLMREDNREKARARTVRWSKANPEKRRAGDIKFKTENPALVRSYKARRRARVRQAVPPWISDEQVAAIQAVYAESERMTGETGVEHEVDHIVPLAGKIVCGLHLPANLRVLTRDDNNRRPRIPDRAELDAIDAEHMSELRRLGLAVAILGE